MNEQYEYPPEWDEPDEIIKNEVDEPDVDEPDVDEDGWQKGQDLYETKLDMNQWNK